jgi:nitronate monooxygenase
MYDGRAVVTPAYIDHAGGVSLDDNLKKYKEAEQAGDKSRMVTWA